MDPIDARVWAEYQLWFSFTASVWPAGEIRYRASLRYFQGRGLKVIP